MHEPDYAFDPARLAAIAQADADGFRNADPYPHLVMDGFLRPEVATRLEQAFPGPDDAVAWDRFGAQGYEVKLGSAREEAFPAPLRQAIHDLNAGPFIRFLEALTGIEHLLPDPHLRGGGLHLSRRGDHLGIHADFNWHDGLQAHRRLNLLIYLNPQWQDGWGGELELWDTQARERVRRVEPLFNRAVLFATRSDTFHGHPAPWAAPEGVHRRSIAMYYYTSTRPAEEQRPAHSTLYKGYHL
ncbi:MAG: 2OG-Fe(II) oxygenase [Xanthomonadales bacterium]|nr:2OG-Fe(II) oxygenase [Xanthomonadales bacterium]